MRRRSVRDGVASLRDNIAKSWLGPVQADLELLRKSASGFEGASPEERQKQFEAAAATIRGSARSIASRSNELGKSLGAEMRSLADAVSVAPGQPGFSCQDTTLASRLRQAAEQASVPAQLTLREVAFNEGPAGVANAVKNLWSNLGSYVAGMFTYIFSGGTRTGGESGGTPITGRDMIALLATIGIDLGIFVLALLSPPTYPPVRSDALAGVRPRLHKVEFDLARELKAAFDTAIARAPGGSLEWVRRHFVHHGAKSYFVIPNLYRSEDGNNDEQQRAIAINQLAGVMNDVKLIRVVTKKELEAFGKEEERSSASSLGEHRTAWRKSIGKDEATGHAKDDKPIRNHGLLSKAERMLSIAGWSDIAKRDPEIYELTDTEGLTPLLALLNDNGTAKPAASTPAPAAPPKPLALEDKRGG